MRAFFDDMLVSLGFASIAVAILAIPALGIYYFPIIGTLLALVLVVVAILWSANSIAALDADEIGVRKWWGEPEERIFKSGLVFVPWSFEIKFGGHPLCELVKVPRKWLKGKFSASLDDQLWTADHQILLADIGWEIRCPFDEADAIVKMIRSGVPMEEIALQEWFRQEVITGVRDVVSDYKHDSIISKSRVAEVREKAANFFRRSDGLFAKSGICGNNPVVLDEGKGEVIIRVETIKLSKRLSDAMEDPVVAKYEADAAENRAKVEGVLAGGPLEVLMDRWVVDQARKRGLVQDANGHFDRAKLAELVTSLKKDGSWDGQARIYKELILADSDNLQVSQVLFGSPDGKPLPPDLQFLSIGGGGAGMGALFGGDRPRSPKKNQPPANPNPPAGTP